MYDTGSGYIFKKYIANVEVPNGISWPKTRNFSVLIKREGEGNP
jgi:hypothetical protein